MLRPAPLPRTADLSRIVTVHPRTYNEARTIGEHDARRIVRALEVGELTGRPFTAFLPRPVHVDPRTIQLGLRLERPQLHERIAERVHRMVDQGLLDIAAGDPIAEGWHRTVEDCEGRLVVPGASTITCASARRR